MIDWDSFKQQLQTNPNRTLGFVLGLAVCLMLIWLAVVVQASDPAANRDVSQSGNSRLTGLRTSLQQDAADSLDGADRPVAAADTLSFAYSTEASDTATSVTQAAGDADSLRADRSAGDGSRLGSLGDVLPTLLVMVVLVGGLWFWVRRKTSPSQSASDDEDFYTVLGRGELFPGQQIALLRVGGEYLLVGGGPQGPQLLRRYTREEWEEQSGALAGTPEDGALTNGRNAPADVNATDWKDLLGRAMARASSGGLSFKRPDRAAPAETAGENNGSGFYWDRQAANGEEGKLW